MNVTPREADPGFRFLDVEDAPPARETPRSRAAPVAPEEDEVRLTQKELESLPQLQAGLALVRGMVRARPWLSLAVGVGVGLAIAGGLATRGGRAVLVTCGRYALRGLLSRAWRDRVPVRGNPSRAPLATKGRS